MINFFFNYIFVNYMNINERLIDLRNNLPFQQDHINYLYKLKGNGFEPKIIYDIGCCVLHWTDIVRKLWPNAKIILFDALTSGEFLYKDYDYFIGVLSNKDNMIVPFCQNDMYMDDNCFLRKTSTLDTVVKNKKFPLPDLVKINVQGCGEDIIQGGKKTISNTTHLIVELQHTEYNLNAPTTKKTVAFIEKIGFKCVAPLFCNNEPDGDYGFENIYR